MDQQKGLWLTYLFQVQQNRDLLKAVAVWHYASKAASAHLVMAIAATRTGVTSSRCLVNLFGMPGFLNRFSVCFSLHRLEHTKCLESVESAPEVLLLSCHREVVLSGGTVPWRTLQFTAVLPHAVLRMQIPEGPAGSAHIKPYLSLLIEWLIRTHLEQHEWFPQLIMLAYLCTNRQ